MSRTRIVKGRYIKTVGGDYNISAEGSITSNAGVQVRDHGIDKGVFYGNYERLGSNVTDDFEIRFSLKRDETYSTIVPFGILDFEGNYENANFVFDYSLMLGNIDLLEFYIFKEDGSILFAEKSLPEVVLSARKIPLLQKDIINKKPNYDLFKPQNVWDWKSVFDPYNISSGDYTKIGSFVIFWDGFDSEGIYDSTNFNGKKLKARIIATKNGVKKTKEVEFSTEQTEVDWVDMKIDKKNKKIYSNLRVNFKDGGEEGLQCFSYHRMNPRDNETKTECPWDKIPRESLASYNKPIIKTKTKSFSDLKKLAIDGLNYHWGRNEKHFIAKNVKIISDSYQFFMNAISTNVNAIGGLNLVYNTNGDWMRSGNPGSIKDPMTAIGKLISRQAICYNIGYIKYSNGWGYQTESSENKEFEDTSAHETGHEILKKYGGTFYSYGHKGSTNSAFQYRYSDAPEFPLTGEIDLMPYFKDNILGGEHKQPNYFKRRVAAEKDVIGLIWLTKIKVK